MSDPLDRIRARAEVHTAAFPAKGPAGPAPQAPANPPAEPVAPSQADVDLAGQVNDLNETVIDLVDRVGALEQAKVDEAMSDMDTWTDPGALAALPERASIDA